MWSQKVQCLVAGFIFVISSGQSSSDEADTELSGTEELNQSESNAAHLDDYALKIREQLKMLKNNKGNTVVPKRRRLASVQAPVKSNSSHEEDMTPESFKQKLKTIGAQPTYDETLIATSQLPVVIDKKEIKNDSSEELIKIQRQSMDVLQGDIGFRFRNGEPGLDRLFETTIPVDVMFNTEAGKLGLNLESVFLSSGNLPNNEFINRYYGTLALQDPDLREEDITDSQSGLAIDLYYQLKGLELRVGTTPIGFELVNQTGKIRFDHTFKNGFAFGLGVSREAVTDSILSYAGLVDPITGQTWGGVMKNAANISLGYDEGSFGLYLSGTKALYEGENVENNQFSQVDAGLYFYPYSGDNLSITAGFNITHMGFEESFRYFTFGHGGYFSPKYFYSVSLPIKIAYVKGKFKVVANMAYGVQNYEEDGALLFPSNDNIDLQNDLYAIDDDQPKDFSRASKSQFASQGGLAVFYDVSYFMTARGAIEFNRAASYNESLFSLGVDYRY